MGKQKLPVVTTPKAMQEPVAPKVKKAKNPKKPKKPQVVNTKTMKSCTK